MKKNFFFLLLLAIIAVSCQKDIEQGSVAAAKTNEVTPIAEMSLFDREKPLENDDVFKKIDAFKAKIAQIEAGTMPETDDGTSENDAIWNIEALMNSQHGRADKPFNKIKTTTSTIRVDLNADGTISNLALLTALNEAQLKLTGQFDAVIDANKHVIAVDIKRKEPQAESISSVFLEVSSFVGSGNPSGPAGPGPQPLGPDDDWLWGLHLGKCPMPTVSTNVGTDAADKLNEIINRRPVSSRTFFTDVVSLAFNAEAFPNPNDVTPGDNYRDYLMYFQDTNLPYSACIASNDMIFYLAGANTIIEQVRPSGKNFISIDLVGTGIVTYLLHIVTIKYGIKHTNYNIP